MRQPDMRQPDMRQPDMRQPDTSQGYTYKEAPYATKYYLKPLNQLDKPIFYLDPFDRVEYLLEKLGWNPSEDPAGREKVSGLTSLAGNHKKLAEFLEFYIINNPILKWGVDVNWEILRNELENYFKVDVSEFKTFDDLKNFLYEIKPGREIVKMLVKEWIEKVASQDPNNLENIVSKAKQFLKDYRSVQFCLILEDLAEDPEI